MKNKLFIILLLLFIPILVSAEEICNNSIIIKEITIEKQDDNITELNNEIIDNKAKIDLKMNKSNSSINYKIIIKNNSNKTYNITKKDNYNTNNVDYVLNTDNKEIKANEEITLDLNVTYKNEIKNTTEDKNNIELNFLGIEKEEINETKENNLLAVIIIIVIAVIAIYFIIKFGKKNKLIVLLIALSFITYTKVNATCTDKIIIEFNTILEEQDALFLTGKEVNIKMKQLINKNITRENIKDNNIKAIKYSNNEPGEENKQEANIVSTKESPFPIYMWYENNIIYWWSEDETPKLNEDSSRMFVYMEALNNIEGLENFNTIDVKDLSHTFAYDTSLNNIRPLKKWNTINVTTMTGTFMEDTNLETLEGLENWNISNVTSLHSTFAKDLKLNNVSAIKEWDVQKVEIMQSIFTSCISIEEIDLSKWETKSLTNMSNMFGMWYDTNKPRLDSKLREIKMSDKFDTSKVTTMVETFANNTKIEDYSFLELFDTSNVTSMKQLFQCNYGLNTLTYLRNWNTSNVEDLEDTFSFLRNLETLEGLENWNVSNVKNMRRTFVSDQKLNNIEAIKNWNTEKVETIELIFGEGFELVDTTPLINWNLTSVINYNEIFYNCPKVSFPTFKDKKGSWDDKGTFYPAK